MSDVENLIIDNYPIIDILKMTITTEFSINSNQDVSISVNNTHILSAENIKEIDDNVIFLNDDIELKKDDIIVVIYNKEL